VASTAAAAHAKRLFDAERWSEAVPALERVALGRSGDDLGNRQLAEYRLAIALVRSDDWNGAQDLFIAIAARPDHLKYNESLLWLAKAASGDCVTLRVLGALRHSDALDRFENPQQKELFTTARFARARGLVALGEYDAAERELRRLQNEPGYSAAVRECLDAIDRARL